MLPSHPTLRFTDIFPPRGNDLAALREQSALYLTYNSRGALYQLLRWIPKDRNSTILLPAFHCTALVEPVVRSGFRAVFYRIRPDLSIDFDDLRSKITKDVAVIVVIHFFGFSADLRPVLELRERSDFYVLEDCAHSFLTLDGGRYIGHRGDFSIFSFYKTVGSLFGGGLRVNLRRFHFVPSQSEISWKESAVIAKRLVEQIIDNSSDSFLKRTFIRIEGLRVASRRANNASQAAEPGFVDDPYLFREDLALATIPALCKWILKSSDWQSITFARRRNYELFGRALQENALLRKLAPVLPADICPWAYPVLLQDRALYEHQLRGRSVPLFTFGELLHPLVDQTDSRTRQDAETLSDQLVLFPVHQNLSGEQVARYAHEVNEFLAHVGEACGARGRVPLPQSRRNVWGS